MKLQKKKKLFRYISSVLLSASVLMQASFPVLAEPDEPLNEPRQAAQERLLLPVQTNDLASWPTGPAITAESAILMEADTEIGRAHV